MDSPLVPAMRPFASTVFSEMSALAAEVGAVNLGQGFPDTQGPDEIVEAAVTAVRAGHNQYAPRSGIPELRAAVAEHQRRFYGLDLDPETQVLVTVGATEGLAAAILALVEPGDEVVTFEPYFDSYPAMVARAGGVLRTVPLRFPDFHLDAQALASAFSDRTRLVILNTPHNPTGRVFTPEELQDVVSLADRYGAWILADEVYEHLVFDGRRHLPVATLPGAAERTISVSSAGKSFSLTGWKVGWVTGPAPAVEAVTGVKQWLTFTASGPFQYAVAAGLALGDDVFAPAAADLQARRDQLLHGLGSLGLLTNHPESTYFAIADLAGLGVTDAHAQMRDLARRHGVVGIPVSAFHRGALVRETGSLVRFAFCKSEAAIAEALHRMGGV